MLLLVTCCLSALATALRIVVSPIDLHYALDLETRASMMAMVDHQHQPTIFNFGSILACEALPMDDYYGLFADPSSPHEQRLIGRLMEHVFPHQELHQFYFPPDVLQRSKLLRDAITERLPCYQPGPVTLDERSSVFEKELRDMLLARVDANPALLGSAYTGWLAWRSRPGRGWQLDDGTTTRKAAEKLRQGHDPDLICLGIAHTIKDLTAPLPKKYTVDEEIGRELVRLHRTEDWKEGYHALVTLLYNKISDAEQSLLALWHGRLLFSIINLHPACGVDIRELFIDYISYYNADDVPPYILEKIVSQLRVTGRLHFPAELTQHQHDLLSAIDRRIPHSRGFWGGIDVYAQKFIAVLPGGKIFHPPLRPCNLRDAVLFFAAGELRADAPVLFRAELMQPFVLLPGGGRQVTCMDMACVLETLVDMIVEQSGLFIRENEGELGINPEAPDSRTLCICTARLIIYNLIFRKTVGLPLSQDFWTKVLRGSSGPAIDTADVWGLPPPRAISCIAGELLAVRFRDYFPVHVLVENRPTVIKD